MTTREKEDYVNGFRFGMGYARNYGVPALLNALRVSERVNGSVSYTAGMCDAALSLAQGTVR
jgi:hypothetical protein